MEDVAVMIAPRQFVRDATYEGFRKATTGDARISHAFTWESGRNDAPALLFLGTCQRHGPLSQDTWFEFSPDLQQVTYVVRLVEQPEGESRGIFEALVSLEEAADLLEMCVAQAMAAYYRPAHR